MAAGAMAGLAYLDYMTNTWMPYSLWKGWSHKGHLEASRILKIPIEGVIPTTNHLEAFNAVLKRKYIHQWQRAGKRLRFDLFVYLLITQILPGIFTRRCLQRTYYSWLSTRFAAEAGGIDLVAAMSLKLKEASLRTMSAVLQMKRRTLRTMKRSATKLKIKLIIQCAMCFHNCMAWSPFWTMQVFWLRHCHPMLTSVSSEIPVQSWRSA
ncbi:hypothetical protein JB92DRAFT_2807711 [Gautieria morchelliformis]|nr:hypothetical protein JB92DRAFT_2807711 [Gautieria morchelliformis]